MKSRNIIINFYRSHIASCLALCFFIFCIALVTLLMFPSTIGAFRSMPPNSMTVIGLPFDSHIAFLPTTTVSPSTTNSTNVNGNTSSPDSQSQNTLSIANTVITLAGIVIALAGLVLAFLTIGGALAGFFGVQEFSRIRTLRQNVTIIEGETKEQQKKLEQTTKELEDNHRSFEEQLMQLTKEGESLEHRFLQFRRDFENQRFLEASYYFNEGTRAYRDGDNEHAIENYKQALELQQDSPRILERLGRAYSNLNKTEDALKYLNISLKLDPENVPTLRSLALCFRYTDKPRATEYFRRSLDIDPSGYEAWDFLGLLYRDQKLIDEAIDAHEKALEIKRRPETEFYLSILLLYSPKGDKIRARELMLSASKGTLEKEHDQRIRPVWKVIIQAGIPIIDGKKEDALVLIQSLAQYITTLRIHDAIEGHLLFLLEGTNHTDWIPEFLNVVKFEGP